jgi:hypothetical protein
MEKNNKDKSENWQGMACTICHAHHPRFFVLRWVLALGIIFLVFMIGFKLGEFKGYFDSVFDGMGERQQPRMMWSGNAYPMMQYEAGGTTAMPGSSGTSTKVK